MKILFALIVMASLAQAQQSWQVSTSRNALTDVSTTIAYTRATDYAGAKDKTPKLMARLSGKACELFLSVPYTVLRGYARVRYDRGEIETPGFMIADDHTAVFLIHQFQQLKTASKIVVEYEPREKGPRAATFDTRMLSAEFDSCLDDERKAVAEEKRAAEPQGSHQKRPTVVTSKPANGKWPGTRLFYSDAS
jgi:hypothetical protein